MIKPKTRTDVEFKYDIYIPKTRTDVEFLSINDIESEAFVRCIENAN